MYLIKFNKRYLISFALLFLGITIGFIGKTLQDKNESNKIINNYQVLPTIIPTDVATASDFSSVFIKQNDDVKTKQTVLNPFSNELAKSNISEQEKINQKYELNLKNEEKDNKLFNVVYLVDKKTGNKTKIFSYQVMVYKGISGPDEKPSSVITDPDEIAMYHNQPTRKIYDTEITPNDKYVLITTEDKVYVYNIISNILNKVYDQNTPEDMFPLETKYKIGYDYCYKPPFIFSPDYSKVYLHKCLWEGSSILVVDLENKTSMDPKIPVGFGSKVFGWVDNKSIFFYDMHIRENNGLYMINTDSHNEDLLFSLDGSVASASFIDGYIYFANYNNISIDLYKYNLKNKALLFIKHVQKDNSIDFPKLNIWKDSNSIIWDCLENNSVYRFVYTIK